MKPHISPIRLFLVSAFIYTAILHTASSQNWVPTPLVIDAKNTFYAFDGSPVQFKFDLSGHPAKIWLVIESRLDYSRKPVAVKNGFKDWHFVNGIDTTIYVSTGLTFEPGTNLAFPWDGHGNEVANGTPNKVDSGLVPLGRCIYYLWGYDYLSEPETAIDFMSIGNFWDGQYVRLYTKDEQGVPLSRPLLMGMLPPAQCPYGTDLRPGTMFKWTLGNNPIDQTLLMTSHCKGFAKDENTYVEKRTQEEHYPDYGAGVFLPNDYTSFVFPKINTWDNIQTVVMYNFIPGGIAQQNMTWGDFYSNVWYYPSSTPWTGVHPVVDSDGEYIYEINGGPNVMDYKYDRFMIMSLYDPTDIPWDYSLSEFYMPGQPGGANTSGLNQLTSYTSYYGSLGKYFVTGASTCLQECIDTHRMLAGSRAPYTTDGSGYVTWANSNGDFFMDMAFDPQSLGPLDQLWACIVTDVRNPSAPREHFAPADRNGFLVSFPSYMGIYEFGVYCPDGTGMDLGFSALTTTVDYSRQRWKTGTICDSGSIYDGFFVSTMTEGSVPANDTVENKIGWVAFDSDEAVIYRPEPEPLSVDADNPYVFSVAQNSPNPFNPTTTISFTLARNSKVSVDVYNVAGQKVDTLANGFMTAGGHSVVWDASGFAAGLYFATVRTGENAKTIKMTLMK
jgi:hypothetical protein